MKEAVKEFTVFKEEMTEIFIDGENAMPVRNINQLEGHSGGTIHGILVSAVRTEATVTAEGNEFKLAAFRTAVHGTTIGRVTTINHLLDIFNHSVARMKSINDFFVMICKDFLENIHVTIMKQCGARNNPLMNEGAGGVDVPQALFYFLSCRCGQYPMSDPAI
jgi:hypothetical protein